MLGLYGLEDRNELLSQDVGKQQPVYTAQQPRRAKASKKPWRNPEIWQDLPSCPRPKPD